MRDFGLLAALLAVGVHSARGDISWLGVTGPKTGSGFANIGAISEEGATTTMTNAVVLVELQELKKGDIIATCTATFDLDTAPESAQGTRSGVVAFPVTGLEDDAVTISSFAATVDGAPPAKLVTRSIRLTPKSVDLFLPHGSLDQSLKPSSKGHDFLGVDIFNDSNRYFTAFVWPEDFHTGKHSRVQIKYDLILHPQSLSYAKKIIHGQDMNIVPFDAMWAGESNEKAYFFDYILRSGATWEGPIGHETVTLTAAPSLGIDFSRQGSEVITFGRNVSAYANDDLRNSVSRYRAGVDAAGIKRGANSLVWEIDNEKPQQDILIEIPARVVGKGSNPRAPH
jgi:hypothetical protein